MVAAEGLACVQRYSGGTTRVDVCGSAAGADPADPAAAMAVAVVGVEFDDGSGPENRLAVPSYMAAAVDEGGEEEELELELEQHLRIHVQHELVDSDDNNHWTAVEDQRDASDGSIAVDEAVCPGSEEDIGFISVEMQ